MNNDDDDERMARRRARKAKKRRQLIRRRIIFGAGACVLIAVLTTSIVLVAKKVTSKAGDSNQTTESAKVEEVKDEDAKIEVVMPEETDTENTTDDAESASDPEASATKETGAVVNVVEVVKATNPGETSQVTYGIDVSRFQGTIDWSQVAGAGINYAMVRVGYRDSTTGEIKADSNAKYNMQEAEKNGIKVGAYFFSTAVSKDEAVEEADWVASYIAKYAITYPVGYNCEGFENSTSRQYNLTKDERSNIAVAFLDEIKNKGYTPIFYASKNEMVNDAKWNTSTISSKYKIWMAWYNQDTSNLGTAPSAGVKCDMWQYSNQGTVPGVGGKVDVDVAYFGYVGTESAKDSSEREEVTADVEALMNFTEVNETVTAKSKTNLRDKPSQGSDSTVKQTLQNGQTATRTGTSSSGWSRVVYDGATYYAVSSYLTTDLSAAAQTDSAPAQTETAQEMPTSGFKTKFTDVNETITAKELVNLRSKPSVTDEDSQVVATLSAGETAVRTGVNNDYGWSRVEYNGQVLYCVSSYIKVVE
ncbi:GH25 family lysozyme [Pseudobutyrivibrio sp. MD2005]|uniref:GH25 family lysozyme n=1 Tax=Pseudobutyrivibrio sp. MD2005 TaxID=1410616 RepID=UPI000A7AC78C|nr:GH25 family lysozyme [Pseudobutyrivibrio sp. MD2005]